MALLAGLAGLCVGSFLNVCIHRLPRRESIMFPGSHCPGCETPLKAVDLVPVASYLWLRGRCRTCRARISPRYPLVEGLTGLAFAAVVAARGLSLAALTGLVFVSLLLVVFFTDLEHGIIPNRITLPGVILGLIFLAARPGDVLSGLGGLAFGGGVLFLLALVSRGGMGMGDVKLGAVMGVFLGWPGVAVALAAAFLAGGAAGLILLAGGRKGRRDPIPFGPFMAAGAVVALFWGEAILRWYLGAAGL